MASITAQAVTPDQAVSDFLSRHGAGADFGKVCQLVQACFPALIGFDVVLQEDPDEEGRAQAIVSVKLPESYPDDQLQDAVRRYHERLTAELPLSHCPLFALIIEFAPE